MQQMKMEHLFVTSKNSTQQTWKKRNQIETVGNLQDKN